MKYHLEPLTIFLVFFYALTYYLSREKKIKKSDHVKLWNVLLLLSFIVSAGLGILLVFRINYGLVFSFLPGILFVHVEAGIALFVISLFHIGRHLDYFRNILRF